MVPWHRARGFITQSRRAYKASLRPGSPRTQAIRRFGQKDGTRHHGRIQYPKTDDHPDQCRFAQPVRRGEDHPGDRCRQFCRLGENLCRLAWSARGGNRAGGRDRPDQIRQEHFLEFRAAGRLPQARGGCRHVHRHPGARRGQFEGDPVFQILGGSERGHGAGPRAVPGSQLATVGEGLRPAPGGRSAGVEARARRAEHRPGHFRRCPQPQHGAAFLLPARLRHRLPLYCRRVGDAELRKRAVQGTLEVFRRRKACRLFAGHPARDRFGRTRQQHRNRRLPGQRLLQPFASGHDPGLFEDGPSAGLRDQQPHRPAAGRHQIPVHDQENGDSGQYSFCRQLRFQRTPLLRRDEGVDREGGRGVEPDQTQAGYFCLFGAVQPVSLHIGGAHRARAPAPGAMGG